MNQSIDRRTMLKRVGLGTGALAVLGSAANASASTTTATPGSFDADAFKALPAMDLGGKDAVTTASYYGNWGQNGETPTGGATYFRDGLDAQQQLTPSTEYADGSGFTDVNGNSYSLAKTGVVHASQFGARVAAHGDYQYAADNVTALQNAINFLSATGGTLVFDAGYYYLSGRLDLAHSGIKLQGACSPTGGESGPRTYLASTSTSDHILYIVSTSAAGVTGVELADIVFEGAANRGGISGNCVTVFAQYVLSVIAYLRVKNCVFSYAADHGLMMTNSAGNYVFNCSFDSVQFVSNGKDGCHMSGDISQIQFDQIFSDGNGRHGIAMLGGVNPLKHIQFNRLSIGAVAAPTPTQSTAGLFVERVESLDIFNIHTEQVNTTNVELRSVKYVNIIGGAIQQKAGTKGVYITSVGPANKNITIDVPGWSRMAGADNYVEIAKNIIVDGLYLGRTADYNLSGGDVTNLEHNFYKGRVKFMYEDFARGMQIDGQTDPDGNHTGYVGVETAAGTGATGVAKALSTNTKGRLELTHGTGGWAAGTQFKVYFAKTASGKVPFDTPPVVTLQPESQSAGLQSVENGVSVNVTNEYFEIVFAKALTAQPAETAKWAYRIIQ